MSNFIVAPIANSEWFIGNSHEKNIVKKKKKLSYLLATNSQRTNWRVAAGIAAGYFPQGLPKFILDDQQVDTNKRLRANEAPPLQLRLIMFIR